MLHLSLQCRFPNLFLIFTFRQIGHIRRGTDKTLDHLLYIISGTLTVAENRTVTLIVLQNEACSLPVMLTTKIISHIFQFVVPTAEETIVPTARTNTNRRNLNFEHFSKHAHYVSPCVLCEVFYCVTLICLLPNYF